VDNRSEHSLATYLRRRRSHIFRALLDELPRPVSILDVGGTETFWKLTRLARDPALRVTLLNRKPAETTLPNFATVVGDARDMAQFADDQFDAVFSNSVIEHVGDFACQRRMALEIRRVGKSYFVQTPNRYFPIEPHTLVPLFALLPVSLRVGLMRRFNLGWLKKVPDTEEARQRVLELRLLTRREMHELFPHATHATERILGLAKSLLAYGKSAGPLDSQEAA
jgi:SAM-dependent methyltransferase